MTYEQIFQPSKWIRKGFLWGRTEGLPLQASSLLIFDIRKVVVGRGQGIEVKPDGRGLRDRLSYRVDVDGLREPEGFIGLPDAGNAAACQYDAG